MINWHGNSTDIIQPPDTASSEACQISIGGARLYARHLIRNGSVNSNGPLLWVLEDFCRQHGLGFVTTSRPHMQVRYLIELLDPEAAKASYRTIPGVLPLPVPRETEDIERCYGAGANL